jgi:hypothetical protein
MLSTVRYLTPFIMELIKDSPNLLEAVKDVKQSIKLDLRQEVMSLSLRIFFGLILCSIVIFSLITLGQHIRNMLSAQPDGIYVSIVLFSSLAISGILSLFLIFKQPQAPPKQVRVEADGISNFLQKNLLTFIASINEGYQRSAQKRKEQIPTQPHSAYGSDYETEPNTKSYDLTSGF